MGKDTIQLEAAISTISPEYLLEFTSEYGISEDLHPELPGPKERIVDFLEGKVEMDLFNLISAPNPTKVKMGTRPHAAHEVPLLTATANRVTVMEDATVASGSSGTLSIVEKSPLDFANEDSPQSITKGDAMTGQAQDELSQETLWKRLRRPQAEAEANALPKVLRKDHALVCPEQSTRRGTSLAAMGLGDDSTFTSAAQETPADVSDLEPLSYAKPHPYSQQDISQSSRVLATKIHAGGVATTKVPDLFSVESPKSKRSMSVPSVEGLLGDIYQPGWDVTNDCHLDTLEACQDMVDHTVLSGEEEIKRLGEEVESLKVVEMKVHGLRNQTKNLDTLLEAEVDMKKATEAKNAELAKVLESLRAKFLDLQLNNNQLSQQVSTLQAHVTCEERIKAIFEEFKKYEDDKVEKRCAEMDERLDALSIDFDEELYPHMLTAIAGHRWVIGRGLRLTIMKCAESIELRQAFANVVSAGIAKESDTGEDAPQWICELHPSSSQLTIPVHSEVHDPKDPWACKEEILLGDAIAANISRAEKKKKCRGLAILLADAATQTDISEDEASPRLLRSKSLPPMYNLDWP
ncbi:hypothetical protein Tco_1229457 [Tanacetum coccineum]